MQKKGDRNAVKVKFSESPAEDFGQQLTSTTNVGMHLIDQLVNLISDLLERRCVKSRRFDFHGLDDQRIP